MPFAATNMQKNAARYTSLLNITEDYPAFSVNNGGKTSMKNREE